MKIRKIIPPNGWKCTIAVKFCGQDNQPVNHYKYIMHTHNYTDYVCFGLICVSSLKYVGKYDKIKHKDGSYTLKVIKPSHYLKHEYAHVLTPNQMHTKEWLYTLKSLGCHIKRYTDNWNYWKCDKGITE